LKKISITLRRIYCVGALMIPLTAAAQTLPWMNPALPAESRAQLLVGAMTLDEKIQQIAMNPAANTNLPGCGFLASGRHIEGIPRLAIPTVRMTNGPIGVAGGDCSPDPQATGVPTQLSTAASWDRDVWNTWGDIVGQETRANAHTIFLAPGMNMGRVPNNGRNFEYMGEDPLLTGSAAVAMTQAIQAHGVLATPKHFVANEQETQRQTMNTVVDQRTLHELYLLPFEMVVKDGQAASLMCSYPRVNGTFSCENSYILKTVLRDQWGFKGFVMSDRGATQSTVPSIKGGLDLEFSTPNWFSPARIQTALAAGQITTGDIDTMLQHRYYEMFKFGQFDDPINAFTPIDLAANGTKARVMAERGSVLLKNANGTLPLNASQIRSIALIGPTTFAGAAKFPSTGPVGFITVNAPYTVTPLQGLKNVLASLGSSAQVTFNDGTDLNSAVNLAKASDVAILMVGDISLEGVDRQDLKLPVRDNVDQEALVAAVASAKPNTVVVLKNGGPIVMPWVDRVGAVLEAWYPGQEDGNAVANLLFGLSNPSGKLPITFPSAERQAATSTQAQWPGVPVNGVLTATYSEGLSMGYRWYDAQHVEPQFPFGYGLSYTSFALSNLSVTPKLSDGTQPIIVSFTVQNTGRVEGAEVPQIYVQLPAAAGEPPKRLVGFQKVSLQPGESKSVTITIDPNASNHPLGIFDPTAQAWSTLAGGYPLYVGTSSRNIVLSSILKVVPR